MKLPAWGRNTDVVFFLNGCIIDKKVILLKFSLRKMQQLRKKTNPTNNILKKREITGGNLIHALQTSKHTSKFIFS